MLLTVPLGVYPHTKQDVIHVVYNLRVNGVVFRLGVHLDKVGNLVGEAQHAVARRHVQMARLRVVSLQLGVIMRNILLASHKGKSEHRQEQTQENPATRG